jgi:hypothetical protein
MTHQHARTAVALLSLSGSVALAGDVVTFEFIPLASSANDMSPDGHFVVGGRDINGDFIPDGAYLWDRVTGVMTDITTGGIATGVDNAIAVSADGTVVIGNIPDPEGIGSNVMGRWTAATGWQSLGHLPDAGACPSRSSGYEVSDDGSTVVGLSWDGCIAIAVTWTEAEGMVALEAPLNRRCRASVVSADGTFAAGFCQGNFSRTPVAWDTLTGIATPLDPTGDAQGEWLGMSDDGSVLLGTLFTGAADGWFDAVKWTAAGGVEMIGNGSVIGGWAGDPTDIADDGTIVGFDILVGLRRAWIQPGGVGDMQILKDWAIAHGAVIPSGLSLEVAQAISADGRTIIGHGFGTGAWIITITPDCIADWNADGVLDFFDVQAFLAAFAAQDPAADLNADGTFDFFDVQAFLGSFSAGCP